MLSKLVAKGLPPLSPMPFDGSPKLDKVIEKIAKTFPDVEPMVRERNQDAILRRFQRRIEADDWSGFTHDDLAVAIRAAFAGEGEKGLHRFMLRDLPEFAPARTFVIEQGRTARHGGLLKAMLDTHLGTYVEGAAHTIALAEILENRHRHLPTRSQEVLATLPEALDAKQGARKLGRRIADSADTAAFLAALPIAPSGGLIDAAAAGFVDRLAPHMAKPETAQRVLDWFAPKEGKAREVGAHMAIDALLAPWQERDPPETWKQTLLDRLVGAFRDPRTHAGGAWGAAEAIRRETFIRWQTGAALDAFLDIVSETIAPEDRQMWANRRPFWEALHKQGYIQAAWVAFSHDAARVAQQRAQKSGIDALRGFGRQVAGGTRAKTSILILKINGRTVVEGSHSYKVHVFPKDHPEAPAPYKPRYDCEEIRLSLPDISTCKRPHNGDAWKDFVRRETRCPPY